jgi:hypothetical protein
MKALVAGFIALSVSLLCAGQASARDGRVAGHSGQARLSQFSRNSIHPGGLHIDVGRSGTHLRFGVHPFLGHRHFVPHRSFLYPSLFHSGFFFRRHIIGVVPSSVVVWSYPGVRGLVTPGEIVRDKDLLSDRPLITLMLRQRNELGLSPDQVQSLEKLRTDFHREAIRQDADIRIAEVELQTLLQPDTANLEEVKAKLQKIERLRMNLRLARIRTIEQGKALLSPEQRAKLKTILGEPSDSQFQTELWGRVEEQPE